MEADDVSKVGDDSQITLSRPSDNVADDVSMNLKMMSAKADMALMMSQLMSTGSRAARS